MTCKDIDPVDTRPRTNNIRLKKGPKMKRKASSRKNRNSLYFKSCSMTSGSNTKIVEGNDSTQNLVETEFRILQSLIPGISEKNEISEVREDIFKITKSIFHINNFDESIICLVFFLSLQLEIIDACVQYIETLQGQLEDHLVQNPHLNMQYQDSIRSGRNNGSQVDLLHRLLYDHQNSQTIISSEGSTCSTESHTINSAISGYSSSSKSCTNPSKKTSKSDCENQLVEKSSSNDSKQKRYRIRC